MTKIILETERLIVRRLELEDAVFILELLNEPAFIQFIGDRGVRNLEDAQNYLVKGPLSSYEHNGFGLWMVQLKSTQESLGICGLIKRETLPDIDLGYAFLERYRMKGYASEAARAVKEHAMQAKGLKRLVAITNQDNTSSIKVLEKIGMKFERLVKLSEDEPELNLFAVES